MTSSLTIAIAAVAAAAAIAGSSPSDPWRRPSESVNRGSVYVAGLIPLTSRANDDALDDDKPAPDVLQAVLMAVDDVNRNRQILPNHELHLVWNDTKVRVSSA